jgi:hypothetical protein
MRGCNGCFSSFPAELGEQAGLRAENGLGLGAVDFPVAAIRIQHPGLAVIAEVVFEFLGKHPLGQLGLDDRKTGFDTPEQIAF